MALFDASEENGLNGIDSSEISITLNGYDDIFSDFDARPFSQKSLSDDFLSELKRASRDKPVGSTIDLNLHMSASKRSTSDEHTIKRRLHEHFKKHYVLLQNEKRDVIRFGSILVMVGILLMFVAAFILFSYSNTTLIMSLIVVLLEPGGWFLFWEGMDQVIFEPRKKKHDLVFYQKMSSCNINFLTR